MEKENPPQNEIKNEADTKEVDMPLQKFDAESERMEVYRERVDVHLAHHKLALEARHQEELLELELKRHHLVVEIELERKRFQFDKELERRRSESDLDLTKRSEYLLSVAHETQLRIKTVASFSAIVLGILSILLGLSDARWDILPHIDALKLISAGAALIIATMGMKQKNGDKSEGKEKEN